jgi:D-threo-aldose 1-dehydrogenase
MFRVLSPDTKLAIVKEWFACNISPFIIDSAGKYGAGLALEEIGRCLSELGIPPEQVVISNKLGWLRVPLKGKEPTFERDCWVGLEHDAIQDITYDGILRCWEQGNKLLGGRYRPKLGSVHDPDEYLAAATTTQDREKRMSDVLGAYRALGELKEKGELVGIGVGSKDWTVIRELHRAGVRLDWVMFACSLTLMTQPPELFEFIEILTAQGTSVLNSGLMHGGFLSDPPSDYFNYHLLSRANPAHKAKFEWRDRFFALCREHGVAPMQACMQFSMRVPGVCGIALNSSSPGHAAHNVNALLAPILPSFWKAMEKAGLLSHTSVGYCLENNVRAKL